MGKDSRISWTDATHNFWYGCVKVSPGCAGCYADRDMTRYGKSFASVTRAKGFDTPRKWERQMAAGTYPGQHHGETVLVFTCSWSDFFIAEADPWRAEAWDIIRQTPHLTYQILTKRPERIVSCLPEDWGEGYANVWLGVSVENPRWLRRIETLAKIPARVHFASCEPLLKDLGDLTPWLTSLQWVIVGGESGPGRRPMALAWLYRLVEQCQTAQIPAWVKQASAYRDGMQGDIPDHIWQIKQLPLGL
jgi:protein gp37